MEEIKEAKVIEETEKIELTKPEFKSEIKAELKGITQIEDNINDVKEYALKLSDYYSIKEFDEDTLKDAKNERAEVNKFKDKVADFRKEITKKFNEPLEKFTTTAKVTVRLKHMKISRRKKRKKKLKVTLPNYVKLKILILLTMSKQTLTLLYQQV